MIQSYKGFFIWSIIKYKTKELNKKNLIKNVNSSQGVIPKGIKTFYMV